MSIDSCDMKCGWIAHKKVHLIMLSANVHVSSMYPACRSLHSRLIHFTDVV